MKNRVCEVLNIEKPIIQAPTAWLTNADYVAAASEAGGLGVLGFNAGQTEAVYTVEETIGRMRDQIRKVREKTDKPIGINILTSTDPQENMFTEPMRELMAEEGVDVAVCVGEIVPEEIEKFHKKGIKVIFRMATPTVENTKEAIDAGADIIVATGFDEGGTVPEKVVGTISVVPMVVDAAEGRVPVMAAGGIADERTARAVMDLGAEGLYVGTAFLLSKESPLADNIKQMAVEANADDLLFYRTEPAYYRSLPGKLPDKLLEMSNNGASREEIFEAQHGYFGMRNGMLFGDLSNGFASFGLGISLIHNIEPVKIIMDRLMKGVES